MATKRIDQVIPTFAGRDAIGSHSLEVRQLLRDAGYASNIYYLNSTADVSGLGAGISAMPAKPGRDDWLLYQLSIGSPAAEMLSSRSESLLVNYHNITPASLLEQWEPAVAVEVAEGRQQMQALAARTKLAVADSAFNEGELQEAGYGSTAVAPILFDPRSFGARADPATVERLGEMRSHGGADLLFVGKISPHKAEHDLVKALAVYRRTYDPRARLHLVGSPLGSTYPRALDRFIARLGLRGAVEVTGSLTGEQLAAYYACADVFVCASDHEGFCVPLVEAMHHGLPAVAYAAAAVPETLGDAGLLVELPKDASLFAAGVHKVISDGALRSSLIENCRTRLESYSLERARETFLDVVRSAVGDPW